MTLAKAMIVASIAVLGNLGVVAAESAAADGVATAAVSHDGLAEGAIELAPSPRPVSDPCLYPEVAVVSSRPTWTGGAATIQCGVVQSDFGWLGQPVGGGTRQWMLPSSISYGLTPKLNLRWGLPGHIAQGGGNSLPLSGISDQSISALYRFQEQRPRMPALAFGYGVKIPSAYPRKGFGTGFTDHQMVFVVSRDLGRSAHVDSTRCAHPQAGSAAETRLPSSAWPSRFRPPRPSCWFWTALAVLSRGFRTALARSWQAQLGICDLGWFSMPPIPVSIPLVRPANSARLDLLTP